MAKFTVDTQLFRELGELLVGRESTALVELIKNSYDADSSAVTVFGSDLDDPANGGIVITDNGVGMIQDEFENGFLRIATRTKAEGTKRSSIYGRRFTGEKGIGRLALHKLARRVQIESFKWNGNPPMGMHLPFYKHGVEAIIDWDVIEAQQTLDQIEESNAVSVERLEAEEDRQGAGTIIILTNLRRRWTEKAITKFHDDVATLVPPDVLVDKIPTAVLTEPLIFETPRFRDATASNSGDFRIVLLGDLAYSDSLLASEIESAHWILELDCDADARAIRYQIAPTQNMLEKYPQAKSCTFELELPDNAPRISFQARVLQKSGNIWGKRYQGIRVYMEGFRVLPYGEPTDDWLNLTLDYSNRGQGRFKFLQENFDHIIEHDRNAALVVQSNAAYFGAVFLTNEGVPQLQMLINREGFLPGPAMDFIRDRMRVGLDLLVRFRYAATKPVKRARRQETERQREAVEKADVREQPSAWIIRKNLRDTKKAIAEARTAVASGNVEVAEEVLERASGPISNAEESIHEVAAESAMFRVLASIGTELAAFTHEINGLLEMTVALDRHLQRILNTADLNRKDRAELQRACSVARDLRQSLERQAVYLVDINSVDARRRRSRQLLTERFDAAARLITNAADRRGIVIENHIDGELRSPPMFPAEITAIFANLLTNAVKFANKGGRIKASSNQSDDGIRIRIENEGTKVELTDAEKWFEPFWSTTTEVDATLGQGMGMGLTITRSMLDEYGARIAFVAPSEGFDAAVELMFPDS